MRTAMRSPLNSATTLRGAGSFNFSFAADTPATPGATRVALLKGCVMEGLFRETNRSTERVLVNNGCELVAADAQMCCGALHAHVRRGPGRGLRRLGAALGGTLQMACLGL